MPIVSQLKNKTILVTGGARRLGKAIALAAAGAGANVAITYLSSVSQARLALEEINQRGGKGLIVPCDVRKEESAALAVNKVADTFGGLDVLVNNAGMFASARFDEITVQEWDDMFAANVRGPFLMSKLGLPFLRKTAGRIIHMGSLGGHKPWATHAHYCSSKAALHMLTRVMAKALAPEIAVNCVAPGMIDTVIDAPESGGNHELLERLAAKTPMRRNGTTDDVVDAVMYFATASHFITGQILTVDGGLGL